MHRPVLSFTHLCLHRYGKGDQEYGQSVLQHNEYLAEHHLGLAPVAALHHLQGFVSTGYQRRNNTADDADSYNDSNVRDDITRRPGDPDRDIRVVQEPVHHRTDSLGE